MEWVGTTLTSDREAIHVVDQIDEAQHAHGKPLRHADGRTSSVAILANRLRGATVAGRSRHRTVASRVAVDDQMLGGVGGRNAGSADAAAAGRRIGFVVVHVCVCAQLNSAHCMNNNHVLFPL